MPGQLALQNALNQPYNRITFVDTVLSSVFDGRLTAYSPALAQTNLTDTERKLLQSVDHYADLRLDDGTDLRCFEIRLQPNVRVEQSRVGIQQYVRKLLTAGQAVLVNFVSADSSGKIDPAQPWRLTLVAKDTALVNGQIKDRPTNAKRYTYLLGPGQACRTAAERLVKLFEQTTLDFAALVQAFEVEKLSKDFFKEYKRHYDAVNTYLTASAFRASVFNGDEKAVRDWTRKLLGRVVFLYFVQKKGWLGASDTRYQDGNTRYQTNFLTDLFHDSGADETFYPNWLSPLFFETLNRERPNDSFTLPGGKAVHVPFLNGGLFDRDTPDRKGPLVLPPRLFHNNHNPDDPAQRGFLDFLNAYNFTVHEDSPDDHTVAVDPEMLGNIFENLLEDNKDKGAFYTPRAIVHYMCRESLIEYLDTARCGLARQHSPNPLVHYVTRSELTDWVADKLVSQNLQNVAGDFEKLLNEVKICDPAIGSGAFPMGLLQEIYQCQLALGSTEPHAQIKLNIIQNSIYGVDIERGAVDIARLRFWLSLVVDEDQPRPLPNLDYKIVVGNSLVSKLDNEILTLDWTLRGNIQAEADIVRLTKLLAQKQRAFFTASGNKTTLQREIRDLKIELLTAQIDLDRRKVLANMPGTGLFALSAKDQKKQITLQAQIQGLDATLRKLNALKQDSTRPLPYFDWRLDFPEVLNPHVTENVGFDIVIGNPPYIRQEELGDLKLSLKTQYKTFAGTADILVYFYELGIELLKENGALTLITSNKFIKANYGGPLRNYLWQYDLRRLTDFGELPVFDNAATFPLIVEVTKRANPQRVWFTQIKTLNNAVLADTVLQQGVELGVDSFKGENWNLTTGTGSDILQKMKQNGTPLSAYVNGEIYRGVLTGFNEAFVISADKRNELIAEDAHSAEIIVPFAAGDDVRKYNIRNKGKFLILTKVGVDINRYSAIFKHLRQYQAQLEKRWDKGNFWWELRSCAYYPIFEKPKIVYPDIAKESRMSLATEQFYFGNTVYVLPTDNKYLLGVLNSKSIFFFYSKIASVLGDAEKGGRLRWFSQDVKNIPIAESSSVEREIIETLVNQILDLKRADPAADTLGLEAEIDLRVYHLYGLTHAEVLLIDPAFGMSEETYRAAG